MRLMVLLVTAIGLAAPAAAQQPPASSAAQPPSSSQDAPRDLPVSLEKIREALERAATVTPPLRPLKQIPDFKVEIRERQKIDALLATLDFTSPVVPGGLYGYDQQQRLWPKTSYPFIQPYGAFNTGELITVSITTLLQKYFAGRLMNALTKAVRTHEERAARDEVVRALAEFCAAQPYRGQGIQGCDAMASAIR